MGTRADFYVGCGPKAEWIGSVAWDGCEWADDPECPIMTAKTADEFRARVLAMFDDRDDVTLPKDGWPWPWETSAGTDYAYYFDGESVKFDDRDDWPDMTSVQKVRFDGGSGLIVVT